MSDAPYILCIEDEATLLADLQEELCAAGYQVRVASSVNEALHCLQHDQPDLVLCDVMLGGDHEPDGYFIHQYLREQRPDLAATPFIMLTALGQRDQLLMAKRQGVDDYLVKPVDYDLLLATISARLALVGRVRSLHHSNREQLLERMSEVLAQLPGAVLMCDGEQQLLHANHKAQQLMQETGVWHVQGSGRLTWPMATAAAQAQLQQRFRELKQADKGMKSLLTLEMLNVADNVLLSLLKLDAGGKGGEEAIYALFICSAQSRPVPEVETLRLLYGLTRSEAKVARLLARGRRSEEIATELDISATTVAFHLRNLFQKTGVTRQSDLVAQVLAVGWTLPDLADSAR